MVKGKNAFKKLSAMLLALVLIFCTASAAFADEVSGLELSEVEQAETGLEQY